MKSPQPVVSLFSRARVAVLGVLFAPLLAAQSMPPAESSAVLEKDEPILLSLFEVTGDTRGYLASNALSGTRLNTKLEDIPASITVITKQQLLDTAVTDINDLFLYEASTEGTGNYTAFTPNRDGGINDDIQTDPQVANRIRGLSPANTAIGNFASNPKIPFDLYNIDAIELSRGPNSNIFGIGTGSGTINLVPSSANPSRRFATVTLRTDSNGGTRGSFDVNQPLLADKLALRVAAVREDKEFERKPSFEDTKRLFGAVTYKPFKRTTLRVSGENYARDAQRPNNLTPQETVSSWLAFGSPSWDPTTQRVTYADGTVVGPFAVNADNNLPFGLMSGGGAVYNRTSLYIEPDGSIGYWGVNRTGNQNSPLVRNQNVRILQSGSQLGRERATLYPLFIEPGTTDKAFYDWTKINYVAPNRVEDEAQTYIAELEHFLLENDRHLVATRVGWFRQNFERMSRNMVSGNDAVIYVDVNSKLPNGTPNPYFKRPYVAGGWPIKVRQPEDSTILSADLVYQFTTAKADGWLGMQRLNLHGEKRRNEDTNYRYRDYIVSDETWINPSNRINSTQTNFLYYLGDNQGFNVDYAPSTRSNFDGTYPFNYYNGVARQWVTTQSTLGEAPITGTNTKQERIRTVNLIYQGFFWQDRIVATLGFRRDWQKLRRSAGNEVDPSTGLINNAPLEDFSGSPWLEQRGDTKTYGVVVKATPNLIAFYNYSDSFNPLGISYDIFGEVLPNPTSKGEDYGVQVNLLTGKLVVRINRYDTTESNSRRSQIGTVGSRIHRLEGWRQPYGESFYPWAENLALQRFQNQGVTPSAEQLFNAAAAIMQLDPDFLRATAETGAVGVPADVASKGYEIEAIYNPSANWRFKFNLAQQKAIDSNIGDTVTRYLEERLPVWTTAADDNGNLWWEANNGAARVRYLADILAPYSFEVANAGKPRSQVREWRANALTNYDFADGLLRNWSIGGAVRWESKAAIGFRGRVPDVSGIIFELDPDQPIYDKARAHFDFNVGYRFKFAGDRVRGRVQLNIRDAFEGGRLQTVAVNPDGSPYAFRIIDPRQFILTTTFEL